MTTKCKLLCAGLLVLLFCAGAPSDGKTSVKMQNPTKMWKSWARS